MRSTVWVLVAVGLAWSALASGDPTHDLFDKGKWKEAVTEANREVAASPKDSRPHTAFAQLLENMGLGEAARREARIAVQLQPTDSFSHVILGWTLAHDAFGRPYASGSDRTAALAELEKARKLDPRSFIAAAELGNLLAHGDRGKLWGKGSDAKAAAMAKRAAYDIDPTPAAAAELVKALLWSGDFAGAEQLVQAAPRFDDRNALWLVAIAGHSGAAAAIRAAATLGSQDAKKQALESAASNLFAMRRYEDARALSAELQAPGTPQAEVFAHTAIHDQPLDRKTPFGAAVEAMLVFMRDGKQQAMWDAKTEAELAAEWNRQSHAGGRTIEWSDEVFADMMRTASTSLIEGDKKAWRIEIGSTGSRQILYAADDHGTIKLIGAASNTHGLGRHALRLIANNDLETATRVLDWAEKDAKKDWVFDTVWGPNHATDRQAVQLAAAVLAGTSDPDHVRPILESCDGAPPHGDLACTIVLSELSEARGARDETISLLTKRVIAHPKEQFTTRALALALTLAGRTKDAEAVLRELGTTSDPGFAKLRMEIAVAENDLASAIQIAEAVTKTKQVTSGHLNELAWLEVVANTRLSDAVVTAGEAVKLETTANTLHTKAVAEAEAGDLRNAVEDDQRAIGLRLHGAPANGDWYLQGRIAELVGLPDDAVAAYRRVKAPRLRFSTVPESDTLASRRLAALGKP